MKIALGALALMAVVYGVTVYRAVKEMAEAERDEDGRLKLFEDSLAADHP
jgi:hypothetical protein